jgi:hypothetical protein
MYQIDAQAESAEWNLKKKFSPEDNVGIRE